MIQINPRGRENAERPSRRTASRGISFHIVGARGQVRDVPQADAQAEETDGNAWIRTSDSKLGERKAG